MTGGKRARGWTSLTTFLLVALAYAGPVHAESHGSTKEQLEAAQARVGQLRAEATDATVRYEEAQALWYETRDEIAETLAHLEEARAKVARLQRQLDERARAAYLMGGTGTLELLLTSENLSEFSDRVVFLDQLAEKDADIVTNLDVLEQELKWEEQRLEELEAEHQAAAQKREAELDTIQSKLSEASALEAELEDRYAEELAAARAAARAAAAAQAATPSGDGGGGGAPVPPGSIPPSGTGALQACPAPGTSFTDTFGAPRSGGRTHQGVDMMGNYGMPIYAAQSGNVSFSSSSLGGNQAYVHAANGDYTFYAHLQSYASVSGHVEAGTQIGTMGDTGNATGSPHLHFEYHPGGGAAVNPTPYVSAVC